MQIRRPPAGGAASGLTSTSKNTGLAVGAVGPAAHCVAAPRSAMTSDRGPSRATPSFAASAAGKTTAPLPSTWIPAVEVSWLHAALMNADLASVTTAMREVTP